MVIETNKNLPSDVRYVERFRYYPRIAPCAHYDYLSVYNEVATLQVSYHCDAFMNVYALYVG